MQVNENVLHRQKKKKKKPNIVEKVSYFLKVENVLENVIYLTFHKK